MRALRLLVLASLAGAAPAVAPGTTTARAPTNTLRFLTGGLSCNGGVCALASGNVGANYEAEHCDSGCSVLEQPSRLHRDLRQPAAGTVHALDLRLLRRRDRRHTDAGRNVHIHDQGT